ncbi:MAG: hypothetical protein JW732_05085 [Dehalococcoidia bacterium]|nr:hypothetical protein [Dehalococcoidia bacterium]
MKQGIESVLSRIRPSLRGADVSEPGIGQGIAMVQYYRPLSNPSACHAGRTQITKEIVIELL